MKRRTFLRLTGATAVLGLPWLVWADQRNTSDSLAELTPTCPDLQRPDIEEGIAVIKVIGVGGAGGNAVEHMIREKVRGIEFICCNTDAQALGKSRAPVKLQLGIGLGAGGQPEIARALATNDRARIAESLAGTDMVFIAAGMGGGTGTGVSPIVAQVARELGIISIAVVTKPFAYEGKRRLIAEVGIAELEKQADALIVISNDKLDEILGDEISMLDAFRASDNAFEDIVTGLVGMINTPGMVNIDLEDLRSALAQGGRQAVMGSATARGVDRARSAAEAAMAFPLMDPIETDELHNVLVNIVASHSMTLLDYKQAMRAIRGRTAPEAHILCSATFDNSMEDRLRVTVVALGRSEVA